MPTRKVKFKGLQKKKKRPSARQMAKARSKYKEASKDARDIARWEMQVKRGSKPLSKVKRRYRKGASVSEKDFLHQVNKLKGRKTKGRKT